MSAPLPPASRPHWPWAIAVSVVAVAAILTGGVLYVVRSARRLPADVVESSRRALRELGDVAAAFRTGTITTSFRGDAARLQGTTRLQFFELRQLETFERRDAESVLWGTLALPDVVVEARAPITYEYYLDLEKPWRFRSQGHELLVLAPAIEWNPPAVDVSALRYEVRAGSVFRNEQVVQDRLRSELSGLASLRARQHLPLAREAGRPKVEAFVETWLASRFSDGRAWRARVRFADEPAEPSPSPPTLASPAG